MKRKFGLAAIVLGAVTLGLVGALRDVSTTKAGVPLPIQPVGVAASVGGQHTTALGGVGWHQSTTSGGFGLRGESGASWSGGGGGRGLPDIAMVNGTGLGQFIAQTDISCDATDPVGGMDIFATAGSGGTGPFTFTDQDTDLIGSGMSWAVGGTNGFPVTARFQASIDYAYIGGVGGLGQPFNPPIPVNILTLATPWTQRGSASTIGVGGSPALPTALCIAGGDAGMQATNGTIPPGGTEQLISNPLKRGDSGKPCTDGTCADLQVYGIWSSPSIATAAGPVTITNRILNAGPNAGDYKDVWHVEAPAGVTAVWTSSVTKTTNAGGPGPVSGTARVTEQTDPSWSAATAPTVTVSGKDLSFPETGVPAGQTNSYAGTLTLTCGTPGDYLVSIKDMAYPINATKDNDLNSNAAISTLRLECPVASSELDIQTARIDSNVQNFSGTSDTINPTVDLVQQLPPGDHIQLFVGDHADVQFSVLARNQSATAGVPVTGWLSAETSDLASVGLAWNAGGATAVYGSDPTSPPSVPGFSAACFNGGADCTGLDIAMNEPAGKQILITADLAIACNVAGTYMVPIKAVTQATGYGDSVPMNNSTLMVATVYCWANPAARTAAIDGIDDSTGMMVSWSANTTVPDARKSITSSSRPATSIGADTGYVERVITSECFFFSDPGLTGAPGVFITPAQSMTQAPAGLDKDGDCLPDASLAQPGHAVDFNDAAGGAMCPTISYNEGKSVGAPPNAFTPVAYTVAQDEDCDGVIDGIEVAYGSNPRLADSDSDGSPDFVEMFEYTNPVNPDTDGDGFLDAPAPTYQNSSTSFDNCPGNYNPPISPATTQLNSAGLPRPAGTKIPSGIASNPNKSKLGDACNPDWDMDGLSNAQEALAGTLPLVADTDGDGQVDYQEVVCGSNPLLATSKCSATINATMVAMLHGCHVEVPGNTAAADFAPYAPDTAGQYVENDPDGDGITCATDTDADNGHGTGLADKTEITDSVEALGYNTAITREDTDGDGCADWIAIMDINGDRKVTVGDQLLEARRVAGIITSDPVSDKVFDVNKDAKFTVGDNLLMAKNTCVLKPGGIGCTQCPVAP